MCIHSYRGNVPKTLAAALVVGGMYHFLYTKRNSDFKLSSSDKQFRYLYKPKHPLTDAEEGVMVQYSFRKALYNR